jgi:hypothetical protein
LEKEREREKEKEQNDILSPQGGDSKNNSNS